MFLSWNAIEGVKKALQERYFIAKGGVTINNKSNAAKTKYTHYTL